VPSMNVLERPEWMGSQTKGGNAMSIGGTRTEAPPEQPSVVEHRRAQPSGPTRALWLAVILALVVGLVGGYFLRWGLSPSTTTTETVPTLSDPAATAAPLVDRFFTLLEKKDVAGLQSFLSPAFQVQRADGSAGTKADELKPGALTISSFSISNLGATQAGSALIVHYLVTARGSINGRPYAPGPAPRLSVFVWDGSAWQLAAHANFNPLTG
jgi:hypothetical protein